jgi:hypothetical protein
MACATMHVVNYSHRPERELTYSVLLAHVLILLDHMADHFKFHDRIKHCSISFQIMIPRKAQGDKRF